MSENKTQEKQSILQQFRNFWQGQSASVKEIIGNSRAYIIGSYKDVIRRSSRHSIDTTIPDYAFWDKLRHGKQKGFEIAGLFAQPVTQIMTSWVLGTKLMGTLSSKSDPYTNRKITNFFRRNHGELVEMVKDLYALGDQYVVINNDGSLYIPSPELVDLEYDLLDHRKIVKAKITTKRQEATVIDEYYETHRMLTIQYNDARPTKQTRYENLIGRIPVVHFANDRARNETNGRPIYDALFRLLSRYDTLVEKGLDGAELLGNPMPTFSEVDDVDDVIRANADPDDVYVDADGNEHPTLNWANLSALFVSGKFSYESPRINFTQDIREMLKVMFLLILEFTRIPEAVWGGELTSSRSTAIEQMKTFFIYIKYRRLALEGRGGDEEEGVLSKGGLLEVVDLWLRTKRLTDPRVSVGDVTLFWEHHSAVPADVLLKSVQWAAGMGWMSSDAAMSTLGLVDEDALQYKPILGEDEDADQFMSAARRLMDGEEDEEDMGEQALAQTAGVGLHRVKA